MVLCAGKAAAALLAGLVVVVPAARAAALVPVVAVAGAVGASGGVQPAAGADSSSSRGVFCGSERSSGLGVYAVTAKRGSAACSTARNVAGAYTKESAAKSRVAVSVRVEGALWVCGERQGDVDPYLECVNSSNPAEKVRQFS